MKSSISDVGELGNLKSITDLGFNLHTELWPFIKIQQQTHHLKRRLKILDVGCGQGGIANWFFKGHIFPEAYVGVDAREEALKCIKKKFKHFIGVHALFKDMGKSVPKLNYDVCVLTEVLEHIKESTGKLVLSS